MGIKVKETICPKTQDEFHTIDKIITGHSFEIHNDIGRFCDEIIYQEMLKDKCINRSLNVSSEVEIAVMHKDFRKVYKLDLLVENGVIYELKTVQSLNDAHKQQLINYLLLTGIHHGKLLNFRSSSVEYEFVSTQLANESRYDYSIDLHQFKEVTNSCRHLNSILCDLLDDWGAFLECGLYNEALIYFLGGEEKVIIPVEIYCNNREMGKQKMQLLNNNTGFHVSAITKAFKGYENNIRKLIKYTKINTVQWINLNRQNITIKTIQ